MLQNFQFKLSEVKINTELLDTILSEHLIYRRVFKVIEKLSYCQTKQNTQVLHALVICFRKLCPPSLIRLTREVYTSYYFTQVFF